jgi:hypothetical protein
MTRDCHRCGQWYLRRDQLEVWSTRNPGHRDGWKKSIVKVCMHCATEQQSRRLLMLASVKLGGQAMPKRTRAR